jgi:hypothetical protein
MFLHRVGAELLLITLTLWLQSAGVAALIAWVRRALGRDTRKIGTPSFCRAGCAISSGGCRSARIGDSAVGRFLSLALLAVVGLGGLLLSKQLFNPWLQ